MEGFDSRLDIAISTDHDNRHDRSPCPQYLDGLQSRHAGHPHVEQNQVDGFALEHLDARAASPAVSTTYPSSRSNSAVERRNASSSSTTSKRIASFMGPAPSPRVAASRDGSSHPDRRPVSGGHLPAVPPQGALGDEQAESHAVHLGFVVKNGSNTCGRTSAGIPGPRSETSTTTVPYASCVRGGTRSEGRSALVGGGVAGVGQHGHKNLL